MKAIRFLTVDFFAQFDPNNPLAGDTPMRYRRVILEPGGSMSANNVVKHFLGRSQKTDAFQRWMNEEFQPASNTKQAAQVSNSAAQ